MSLSLRTLASNLRAEKARRNVTTDDMAAALGIAPNTITRSLTACGAPSIQTLCALADYFGVSLDYLCGREVDERTPRVVYYVGDRQNES